MAVNTVSGVRNDFGEALAYTQWECCHPELAVPHTEAGTALPHTQSRGSTGQQEPEAQPTICKII